MSFDMFDKEKFEEEVQRILSTYKIVLYYPKNPGEVMFITVHPFGLGFSKILMAVVYKHDGWCVYGMPDHLPEDYTYPLVLMMGDKIPEMWAKILFPSMEGNYVT